MSLGSFVDWVPGGEFTFIAAALLAVPGVRRQLRPVAKSALRVGMAVTDQVKGWTAETREQANDIVAEIKEEREAEREQADANGAMPPATARQHSATSEA
jgi:hypothetical protein